MALAALLAGCQGLPLPGADATRTAPATAGSAGGTLVARDVEAPEVFSVQDRALWDGRPSLGGVWVAAPNVRDPERIIIRNAANGKSVIGALFKREHAGAGPALQLSSDAAAALGIAAGQPETISAVALRKREVPETVADASEAVPPAADTAATAAAPVVVATALDAPAAPAAPAVPAAAAAAAAPMDRIAAAVAEVDGTPTPAPAPATVPAAAAPAEPAAPSLAERVRRAVAATEAAEAKARAEGRAVAAAPRPTAPAPAAPVRTASLGSAPSAIPEPYVQVGIFSQEENARNTAEAFRQAGIVPTVLEEESRGRAFWRVILGPSTSSGDRAAVLRKARDLGFSDAYPVGG
ncbi:SPOR domain-containing protein [Jannaschia sp. W003]|uniref:SPOR domain-containing protein n=1 Tax=Jannaschia sp. W003 TaxID=2867012 RepID=UPI0021A7CC86|nr:SPOR domain-containing protein [Jannaschia sp. W003]UWQ21051.1 SPOR domain-containing protein [Jannaschia sp. W003]